MLTGLLYAAATGVSWACVSIIMSLIAHRPVSKYLFYTIGAGTAALLSWFLMADRGAAPAVVRDNIPALLIFFAAGVINVSSQSVMVYTLKIGHNGISIAIRNCASVIPFTVGVVFLHNHASLLNVTGLVMILTALAAIAFKRKTGSSRTIFSAVWLVSALTSLLLSGTFQTLNTLLSTNYKIFVTTGMATPILMAMCALGYGVAYLIDSKCRIFAAGQQLNMTVLSLAVMWGIIAVAAYFLMFRALTVMAEFNASALVFPVVTGVSVSLFSIYSKFKLREPYSWLNAACLILCVAGIILLNRR